MSDIPFEEVQPEKVASISSALSGIPLPVGSQSGEDLDKNFERFRKLF
jgi:hypothetical protein